MLLNEADIAELLGADRYVNVEPSIQKRRVRKLAKTVGINPVIKEHDEWLYAKDDIDYIKVHRCHSKQQSAKARHITRSQDQSKDLDVYERLQKRLS